MGDCWERVVAGRRARSEVRERRAKRRDNMIEAVGRKRGGVRVG